MINTVDAHLQFCHVRIGLLQRCSRQSAKLQPGPSAVRHQRCSTPDSWRTAPRPHHSAPCGHPLAVHTSAHPIQAVHTGVLVHTGSTPCYLQNTICPIANAESRHHLHSALSADVILTAKQRATMGDHAFTVAGPRARNNLPDDLSQLIVGHLQTFSENLLLYSLLLLTLFLLLLDCAA